MFLHIYQAVANRRFSIIFRLLSRFRASDSGNLGGIRRYVLRFDAVYVTIHGAIDVVVAGLEVDVITDDLSIGDIRALAEIERRMDRGEQPFVLFLGGRMAVHRAIMDDLGLEPGQSVDGIICVAILEAQIRMLEDAKVRVQ